MPQPRFTSRAALAIGLAGVVGAAACTAPPAMRGVPRGGAAERAADSVARSAGDSVPAELRRRIPTDRVLVVAHRGASGDAPEHTLAAYDLAVAQGADYVDADVRLSADRVLVAVHDASLDRTARGPLPDCEGPVAARSLVQLKRCEVGSWFNGEYPDRASAAFRGLRIPALDELFARDARQGRRTRWYLQLAAGDGAVAEQALLAALARAGLRGPRAPLGAVVVQSFDAAALRRLRAADAGLPLVQLYGDAGLAPGALRARLADVATYATGVGAPHAAVDAAVVAEARRLCLAVHPFTVNDTADMRRLVALGVGGMVTDFPGRLRAIVGPARAAAPAPAPCVPAAQ